MMHDKTMWNRWQHNTDRYPNKEVIVHWTWAQLLVLKALGIKKYWRSLKTH